MLINEKIATTTRKECAKQCALESMKNKYIYHFWVKNEKGGWSRPPVVTFKHKNNQHPDCLPLRSVCHPGVMVVRPFSSGISFSLFQWTFHANQYVLVLGKGETKQQHYLYFSITILQFLKMRQHKEQCFHILFGSS